MVGKSNHSKVMWLDEDSSEHELNPIEIKRLADLAKFGGKHKDEDYSVNTKCSESNG